jgi:hypothetical protein
MRIGRLLLVGILVFAAFPHEVRAAEALHTEEEAREKSRSAFRKGVQELRASQWADARASFESAWAYFPHPSILLNLGIARLHTDDFLRAEQDLVKFLSEDGGASAAELASAREALATARANLGLLRIVVSPASARVVVDGTPLEIVRNQGPRVVAEVRTALGPHSIVIEAVGCASVERRDVRVSSRAATELNVALLPVPRAPHQAEVRSRAHGVAGWSLVGVAGASLVAGGVMALHANALAHDYADASNSRFQDASVRSEGITYRTLADVALGTAIVSGTVGALLLFTKTGSGTGNHPVAAALHKLELRW